MTDVLRERGNSDTGTDTHTAAGPCEDLQIKEHQSLSADHRKLGRGKEGGLAGFRGSTAYWCLDFGLLATVTVRINLCSFQPASLWHFVTAALGKLLQPCPCSRIPR